MKAKQINDAVKTAREFFANRSIIYRHSWTLIGSLDSLSKVSFQLLAGLYPFGP